MAESSLLGVSATRPTEKAAISRVGPNAVIQLGDALQSCVGDDVARDVFDHAGLHGMLTRPPVGMVDEKAAADLFGSLFARLPADVAAAVAALAGTRTADYVLANRIPRLAQIVLRNLPAPLAAPLLLNAIARHAWTFAGSGGFAARSGSPSVIEIAANPLAMPGCVWHVAVFERLFRALAAPNAVVRHPQCCHSGAAACRFEVSIKGGLRTAAP